MKKYEHNEGKGKTLPIKTIAALVFILFIILVFGFMILPAYFDLNPFGKLFNNEPAPWALAENEQKNMELTENQKKGRHHFIEYCASCHGPNGIGDGPSSITLRKKLPNFLNPNTKYINSFDKNGLLQTINFGIPDSEMPSFNYLPTQTKEDIIEFLIHLNTFKNYK